MQATERLTEEQALAILRRMLANGPLTAPPKTPRDHDLLLALAASTFEPGRAFTEKQVNRHLGEWLGRFSSPYGIDHVTVRRSLVDAALLVRDKAGASYEVAPARVAASLDDAATRLDPAAIMEAVRAEREARKRAHAG